MRGPRARTQQRAARAISTSARRTYRAADYVAGLGMASLALLGVATVLSRELGGRGIPGALEISEVVLVGSVYLGLAWAGYEGAHVCTELVVARLSKRVGLVVRVAALVVVIAFLVWLGWASVIEAVESTAEGEYRYGLVQVPLWPAKMCLAIGVVLYLTQVVWELVRTVRQRDASPDQHLETRIA